MPGSRACGRRRTTRELSGSSCVNFTPCRDLVNYERRKAPVRRSLDMPNQRIFFNSSLPRSGSTLLQNILAQNPRFYCSPTSALYEMMYAARAIYSDSSIVKAQDADLMKKAFLGFCGAALRG